MTRSPSTPADSTAPCAALAVPVGSAVRCPIGFDGSPHICSAGTCTICRHFADSRPMTPEERKITDDLFLSHFKPNVEMTDANRTENRSK